VDVCRILLALLIILTFIHIIPFTLAVQSASDYQQNPKNVGIQVGGNPYGIAVNPKSNMIYVVDKFYKKISFIDGENDKGLKTITISNTTLHDSRYVIDDFSTSIAVNPSLNLVYVISTASDTISTLDGSSGHMVLNTIVDGIPRAIGVDNRSIIYVAANNILKSNNTGNLGLAVQSGNNTLHIISGLFNREIGSYTIGNDYLLAMNIDRDEGRAYLPGLSAINNTGRLYSYSWLGDSDNITLNKPQTGYSRGIAINPANNKLYESVPGEHGAFLLRINLNFTKKGSSALKSDDIKSIGDNEIKGAFGIAANPKTNLIYVADDIANKVHVIDSSKDAIIKSINVGEEPRFAAVNLKTNMIYVTNLASGTVSVINGTTNNVTAGITYKIQPPNAGFIICNSQKIVTNYTRYDIGKPLRCTATPNSGFEFSSWEADFKFERHSIISNVFDFISYQLFGNKGYYNEERFNDPNNSGFSTTSFRVSKYGGLTANFISSVSIPAEFWAPLYALIPGFFIPSVISWLNGKRQRKHLKESLDKIGKVDRGLLEKDITRLYSGGKINDSHYQMLKDKIAGYYNDKED
jgi:YVTN family beta-propeller protein